MIRRLLVSVLAIVLVATGAFATDAAGTPTANLLTGGTDQTFSRTDAAGARSLLTDALGSTVGLTDAAGLITTSYTYEPYGKTTVTGSASANTQQFTGRENDGPLTYYRARYLHPTFGRFLSEDPAGFAAGDPNLYAYVGGSPTNATDPSGRYLESAIDLAFIASDLWTIATGSRKEADAAWGSLLLDFGGLLLPFAFGLGHIDDVAKLGDEGLGLLDEGAAAAIKPGSAGGATAGKPFPQSVREATLKANPDTCVYCHMKTDIPQVDHSISRVRGGNATLENAQTTCGWCNPSKGGREYPVNPPPGYLGPWPPPWWR